MHYRNTAAVIDLDRIQNNVRAIKERSGLPHLYAVVKANGYGHGDIEVARAALAAGADRLSVAFLDEALRLRSFFAEVPLLVMGVTPPEYVELAAQHQIELTCHDQSWLDQLSTHRGAPVALHIKLDTGMNRLGFKNEQELKQALEQIDANPALQAVGLFTHFARADDRSERFYRDQVEQFDQLTQGIDLGRFETIHLANSAALLRFAPPAWANAGRLGISMYGLEPSTEFELPFALEQAFSLYTEVVQVKEIQPGEAVSYGGTYVAQSPTYIATLPIGYADGWLRYHQDRLVEINGALFPLVGRICMDQCMVAVDESVTVGDRVALLNDRLSVTQAAEALNTINYEIVCSISDRVPRLYRSEGRIISERNDRLDRILD